MDKISASVLLKGLAPEGFADEAAIDLVTTDSREVRPGCIFVAFPGVSNVFFFGSTLPSGFCSMAART